MRRAVLIAVVIVAAAIAGLSWSISSPPGSSPDEDYHIASIYCPPPVRTSGCTVETGPDGQEVIVLKRRVFATSICYAFNAKASGACIWQIPADAISQDGRYDRGGYPGGYYRVVHLFAGDDPYASTYLMRGVNVALAVLLGTLLVLVSARPTRRILAYAVTATFVPMGMFILPSVNPTSWALTGITTLAFATHTYWLAPTRSRLIASAALAVAGLAMAASARTDAMVYSALTLVLVTTLHHRQAVTHPRRVVLPALSLVADLLLLWGQTTSAAGSALSFEGMGGEADGQSGLQILVRNIVNLPDLLLGNTGFGMGSLGWMDTHLPSMVSVGMITVYAFMAMAGLGRLSWTKGVVGLVSTGIFVAIPLYMLQTSGLLVGEAIQPRYLLPLLPVVALVLLTGARPDEAVRLRPGVAWVTWAIASMANGVALLVNIRRYSTGVDGPVLPGKAVEWWMPSLPGPLATWIGGTIAFAVAAWMVVRLSSGSDVAPPGARAAQDPLPIAPADGPADLAAKPEDATVR